VSNATLPACRGRTDGAVSSRLLAALFVCSSVRLLFVCSSVVRCSSVRLLFVCSSVCSSVRRSECHLHVLVFFAAFGLLLVCSSVCLFVCLLMSISSLLSCARCSSVVVCSFLRMSSSVRQAVCLHIGSRDCWLMLNAVGVR